MGASPSVGGFASWSACSLPASVPTPTIRSRATAIRRCAETVALSEDLRARMLRGEAVSPDDALRASRTADLLTRRLHLDRRKPATMGLTEYLAAREGTP